MDREMRRETWGMDNPLIESPRTVTGIAALTYSWVIALAIGGGVANYIQKVRLGQVARFNFTELIGDMFIAGFTGLLTFWMCQAAEFSEFMTAFFVGVAGHMGGRLIGKMEQFMSRKLDLAQEPVDTKKEGPPGVF